MKKPKTINDLQHQFDDYITSEEGSNSIMEIFDKRTRYYIRELERVEEFLKKNKIDRTFELKMIRFLDKHDVYTLEIKRDLALSNIFSAITMHVMKNGKKLDNFDKSEISGLWEWHGYQFRLCTGLTLMWMVIKGNRIIYQSL